MLYIVQLNSEMQIYKSHYIIRSQHFLVKTDKYNNYKLLKYFNCIKNTNNKYFNLN